MASLWYCAPPSLNQTSMAARSSALNSLPSGSGFVGVLQDNQRQKAIGENRVKGRVVGFMLRARQLVVTDGVEHRACATVANPVDKGGKRIDEIIVGHGNPCSWGLRIATG